MLDLRQKPAARLPAEDRLCPLSLERLDHESIITHNDNNVKRYFFKKIHFDLTWIIQCAVITCLLGNHIPSEDEHAVAVAVEAVFPADSLGVGFLDEFEAGEGGNQHQEG